MKNAFNGLSFKQAVKLATESPHDPRNETLREKIATIVQTGYTEKWTADDVAGKVMDAFRVNLCDDAMALIRDTDELSPRGVVKMDAILDRAYQDQP